MKQCTKPFHIVLVEPEIPPNTGNIGRLCAATGSYLHLVGKLGFSLEDKRMKRAGLDYWPHIKLQRWGTLESLMAAHPDGRFWFCSKKATHFHHETPFKKGDFIVLGKETLGLSEELLEKYPDQGVKIPIIEDHVRSLNLANATAVILYEALRQTGSLSDA